MTNQLGRLRPSQETGRFGELNESRRKSPAKVIPFSSAWHFQ